MFQRIIEQYDKLRKRGAYIANYQQEAMFENGLDEFDDARCVAFLSLLRLTSHIFFQNHRAVAQELIDEYQACERADYIVCPDSPSGLVPLLCSLVSHNF